MTNNQVARVSNPRNNAFPSTKIINPNTSKCVHSGDEFLYDLSGTTEHTVSGFAVNPGNVGCFPMLSNIAKCYEKYRIVELMFYYTPVCTAYSPAGTSGKVLLYPDLDSGDYPPNTKQQFEDSYPHADGMPYEKIAIQVSAAKWNNNKAWHFVRTANVPAGADITNFDVARFYVGVFATPNDGSIGEVRVKYKIEFSNPVLPSTQFSVPPLYRAARFYNPTADIVSGVSDYFNLSLGSSPSSSNTFIYGVGYLSNGLQLQAGWYMFTYTATFYDSSTSLLDARIRMFKNGTDVNNGSNLLNPLFTTNADTVSKVSLTFSYIQYALGPSDLFQFGFNANCGPNTKASCSVIVQLIS